MPGLEATPPVRISSTLYSVGLDKAVTTGNLGRHTLLGKGVDWRQRPLSHDLFTPLLNTSTHRH
eukprot:1991524-Prorocentrum_lima.AAC.1